MPNFKYKCEECGYEFQRNLQLFQKDYVQECPECKSIKTKQQRSGLSSDCGNGGVTPCGRVNSSGCGGGCGV